MTPSHRLAAALLAAAVIPLALTACAEQPAPAPTETMPVGGGSGSVDGDGNGGSAGAASGDSSASAIEQALSDGMPDLGLTGCAQLDEYEYVPTAGNTGWHFVFTCTSRDAFDATAASLVASGYEASPLVISEGSNVSERNHLQADANGGSTEVQLNIVGAPDELEYEIFVFLTLP